MIPFVNLASLRDYRASKVWEGAGPSLLTRLIDWWHDSRSERHAVARFPWKP